jgi:hypothetical protein
VCVCRVGAEGRQGERLLCVARIKIWGGRPPGSNKIIKKFMGDTSHDRRGEGGERSATALLTGWPGCQDGGGRGSYIKIMEGEQV